MKSKMGLLLAFCVVVTFFVGCTGDDGKNKKNEVKIEVESIDSSTGLTAKKISSMVAFAGKVWLSSKNGVHAYDGTNWAVYQKKNANALGSDDILGLNVGNGKLWIATDNGACYFDGERFNAFYTNGRARSCYGSGNNTFVTTANGVDISGRNYNKSTGLADNDATVVGGNQRGVVLVGTKLGLSKYENGNMSSYSGPAKTLMGSSLQIIPAKPANCRLPENNIKSILPFGNGEFAIGTTCGLCITDMESKWDSYRNNYDDLFQNPMNGKIEKRQEQGNCAMPGNIVNALAKTENDELLFIGTDNGLAIMEKGKLLDTKTLVPDLPESYIVGLAYLNGNLYIAYRSDEVYKVKNVGSLVTANSKN